MLYCCSSCVGNESEEWGLVKVRSEVSECRIMWRRSIHRTLGKHSRVICCWFNSLMSLAIHPTCHLKGHSRNNEPPNLSSQGHSRNNEPSNLSSLRVIPEALNDPTCHPRAIPETMNYLICHLRVIPETMNHPTCEVFPQIKKPVCLSTRELFLKQWTIQPVISG